MNNASLVQQEGLKTNTLIRTLIYYSRINPSYLESGTLLSLSVFLPLVFAFSFGSSPVVCVKFLLYALIYHGLNGVLILSLFKQDFPESLKIPAIIISGIGYNILTFFVLSFFHWQQYSFLNVFFLLLLAYYNKTNLIKFQREGTSALLRKSFTYILLLIPVFIGCMGIILQTQADMHVVLQGAIASAIANTSYPYFLPFFPEAPLYYNYGYHLEMAFCSTLTSIPFEALSTRLYPIYMFFYLILTVYSFCRAHLEGKSVTGWLTILNDFCIIGYSTWSLNTFLNVLPTSILLVGSSIPALTIFFILLDRVAKLLNNLSPFSLLDYLFIFFLFFIGSIFRSAFPIIAIGGISFLIAIEFLRTLKIGPIIKPCILNLSLCLIFFVTLIIVYGFFSSFSAGKFLRIVLQNTQFSFSSLSQALVYWDLPFFEAHQHLVYSSIALMFMLISAGYLSIGFYYQMFKFLKNGAGKIDLLLLGSMLSGFVVWNFTEAPGGSQFTFFHYSLLIAGMLGANGTYFIFKDFFQKKRAITLRLTNFLLIGLSIGGLYFKGDELYFDFPQKWKELFHYRPSKSSEISQEFVDNITSIIKQRENIVAVSLLKHTICNLNNQLILSMALNNTPLYGIVGLKFLFDNVSPSMRSRASEIVAMIENASQKDLDITTINQIKSLFPQKDIFLLVHKEQKIMFDQFIEMGETSGVKIIKIPSH